MYTGAIRLSSSLVERSAEELHILKALDGNGYPSQLIRGRDVSRRVYENSRSVPVAIVTLPYVQGVSDAIKRVLGELDIRVSFKPPDSLRNILSHPKDPVPLDY